MTRSIVQWYDGYMSSRTVQCTLYSAQYTVHSTLYSVYTVYTVYTVPYIIPCMIATWVLIQCSLYTVQCTVHSTLYSVQCTLNLTSYLAWWLQYKVLCTLYSVLCTQYPVACTQAAAVSCPCKKPSRWEASRGGGLIRYQALHPAPSTVYLTLCTVYIIHCTLCTLYIVHRVHYTLCTVYIIQCALCTLYNVLAMHITLWSLYYVHGILHTGKF